MREGAGRIAVRCVGGLVFMAAAHAGTGVVWLVALPARPSERAMLNAVMLAPEFLGGVALWLAMGIAGLVAVVGPRLAGWVDRTPNARRAYDRTPNTRRAYAGTLRPRNE